MICQNCHTTVDNDLIFCTTCGERLAVTKTETPTVLHNGSIVTNASLAETPKKSSSNLKWIALIVALIAIPASIFGVYLLMNSNKSQITQNINKPNTPAPSPTRKPTTNANSNANLANTNTNVNATNTNSNADTNAKTPNEKVKVMSERIEIEPKSHYALPFEIEKANTKLIGEAKLLEGEQITGFVYLQENYDEYFPNETYKMFSFGGKKTVEINAPLGEQKYVLIFVNDTDKPITVQGNFSLE